MLSEAQRAGPRSSPFIRPQGSGLAIHRVSPRQSRGRLGWDCGVPPLSLGTQALPSHSPRCSLPPHTAWGLPASLAVPALPKRSLRWLPGQVWRQGMEAWFWRERGAVAGGTVGSQSAPYSQLPISCHFLIFPTVFASVFSSLLSLSLCLSLFLQPLETLSAFLASLGPPRPPHLPIMPPGPSLALRPRDWVWGASQPGLGALSGRQWCRRPLELRRPAGPEQSQLGLKTPSRPKPQVPPR